VEAQTEIIAVRHKAGQDTLHEILLSKEAAELFAIKQGNAVFTLIIIHPYLIKVSISATFDESIF